MSRPTNTRESDQQPSPLRAALTPWFIGFQAPFMEAMLIVCWAIVCAILGALWALS